MTKIDTKTYKINFEFGVLGETSGPNEYDITFDALADGVVDHLMISRFGLEMKLGAEWLGSMRYSGLTVNKVEVGNFDGKPGDDLKIYFDEWTGDEEQVWGHPISNHILSLSGDDLKKRLQFLRDVNSGDVFREIISSKKEDAEKLEQLFVAFEAMGTENPKRPQAIETARPVLAEYLSGKWHELSETQKLDFWNIFCISGTRDMSLKGKFPTWTFEPLWKIVTDESNNPQDRIYAAFSLAGAQNSDLPKVREFIASHAKIDEITKGICLSLLFSRADKTLVRALITETPYLAQSEKDYILDSF